MYNVLLDLLYNGSVPELTNNQLTVLTAASCILAIMGFAFISVALYKLMLFIFKF